MPPADPAPAAPLPPVPVPPPPAPVLPAAPVPLPPAPTPNAAAAPEGEGDPGVHLKSGRVSKKPSEWWKAPAFVAKVATDDPATYAEAMAAPDSELWQRAMDEEIASLYANSTWELERLPDGAKALPVKWVYKVKRDAKGNIERYKARLVVKGFMQEEGIDFTEVYAPVSKHTTLRAFLAEVAACDMELQHLDVKTAFLNGELEERVFIQQPPGYQEGAPGMVCRLRKALYGLRQAPRAWHLRLSAELEARGFTASSADPSLYTKGGSDHNVLVLVYVDDILLASDNPNALDSTKADLMSAFDTRDLGDATFFLGMELVRDRAARTIKLSQHRMLLDIAHKYALGDAKTKATPVSLGTKLASAAEDEQLLDTAAHPYSELVGSLLYVAVCTRPDIAQAVGALARFMSKPTAVHWSAAKGVLRYLASTIDYGITFSGGDAPLVGYCDSDYAGDVDSRRSTTGYVFIMHGGAISWNSRLQPTVAVSTTEAEYMAAASAVKEALWLRKLMADLGHDVSTLKIYGDNQGALKLLKHPIASVRSKHIDVIYHFSRERVARKEVEFEYISTERMVADIMTKALPESKFVFCREGMGVSV